MTNPLTLKELDGDPQRITLAEANILDRRVDHLAAFYKMPSTTARIFRFARKRHSVKWKG